MQPEQRDVTNESFVSGTARRFTWRFVRGSEDKPHRCPKCWGLIAYPFARWWKVYGCRKCKVVWWKGIHD